MDQHNPVRDTRSRAQRWADNVTWFCGSWHFFSWCSILISAWMLADLIAQRYLMFKPFDPYPYIFLNLVLTVVSTLQGPLIMMSQNREMERDREHMRELNRKLDIQSNVLQAICDKLNGKKPMSTAVMGGKTSQVLKDKGE